MQQQSNTPPPSTPEEMAQQHRDLIAGLYLNHYPKMETIHLVGDAFLYYLNQEDQYQRGPEEFTRTVEMLRGIYADIHQLVNFNQ